MARGEEERDRSFRVRTPRRYRRVFGEFDAFVAQGERLQNVSTEAHEKCDPSA